MQLNLKMLCLGLFTAGSLFMGVAFAEEEAASEEGQASGTEISSFEEFEKFIADKGITPACTTCHKVEQKLVGPSYNAVALRYENTEENVKMLADKMINGGSGNWGTIPMTPNPTAKDHAETLAKWILSLSPEGDAKDAAQKEIDAAPKAE